MTQDVPTGEVAARFEASYRGLGSTAPSRSVANRLTSISALAWLPRHQAVRGAFIKRIAVAILHTRPP